MRVALYARVSSEKQVEKDLPIAGQLKALRKYAADREWEVCREFVDEAQSARSADRPAFKEMIALARQKRQSFDAIIVWKLSRFARNREDSVAYKALLRKHGISVISVNEQVDDTASGKLLEGMIEVIDEFYSSNLAEDTVRGMRENASRGYHNGGTIPIGYKAEKVKDGANEKTRLVPDEVFGPIVQRVFAMSLDGLGVRRIAQTLNAEGLRNNRGKPWTNTHISFILNNEAYAGTLVWGKGGRRRRRPGAESSDDVVRVEDNHPALVDRETFDSVQRLLKARSPKVTHPRRVGSGYLLSGLAYCGKCGAAMVGRAAKSSQHRYYGCQTYYKQGKDMCDGGLVNKEKLEGFVIERLKANVLTDENLTELVKLTNEAITEARDGREQALASVEVQIARSQDRLDKLYDALETGKLEVDDLAPRIKKLRDEIRGRQEERDRLSQTDDEERPFLDLEQIREYVADLRALLAEGSIMERKSFLRSFIKRIEVNLPDVTIEYTIPLPQEEAEPLEREVLPIAQSGSPGRTRTTNLLVNSQSLYH